MATRRGKPPFLLGPHQFRTKTEAQEAIRTVLHKYNIGDELEGDDLLMIGAVLEQHPRSSEKIGCGLRAIAVQVVTDYGGSGRCFQAVRLDGTRTDFSFQKVLFPATKLQLFKEACRDIVSPEVMEFRHRAFDAASADGHITCPVLGIPISRIGQSHVDHQPPFDDLVEEFIQLEAISVESVELSGSGDGHVRKGFTDPMLTERWKAFHTTRARLRVVSALANLSTLKRGAG